MAPSRFHRILGLLAIFLVLLVVYGYWRSYQDSTAASNIDTANRSASGTPSAVVEDADMNILYLGNSHTGFHDLPGAIEKLLRFRKPERTIGTHMVMISHLEDAFHNSHVMQVIDSRPWNCVVLQAQKVSMSGKFIYSNQEGIEIARRVRERGAKVFFFSEWAREGVEGERERTERIYAEMSDASGATLIPVGQVWERVHSETPELRLHADDGNHQSGLGALLTAITIASHIEDVDSKEWTNYREPGIAVAQLQQFCRLARPLP